MLPAVRRGILGGTFDPPHFAHLVAGEAAYRDLALDVITFIPAGAPWQKAGREVSAASHRLAMTGLAVAGVEYFEVDDREARRNGWTYTIDTIGSFPASDELVLILGADAARGLPGWQRWEEIKRRAHVAVAPRPGVDHTEVEDAVGVAVSWLDVPDMHLSGTMLRARAAKGKSIRFFVRDRVWDYIIEHGLYADD
jgi:nicotinate-nucleotide adenylyltransferase